MLISHLPTGMHIQASRLDYLILSDSVNQQIPLPTPTWGVQHVEHVDKHGGQPYAPSLRSLEKG